MVSIKGPETRIRVSCLVKEGRIGDNKFHGGETFSSPLRRGVMEVDAMAFW